MTSKFEQPDPEIQRAQIRAKEKLDLKHVEVGHIGKLFGSSDSAALNVAAVICFILVLCFVYVLVFIPTNLRDKTEVLSIIAGIVLPIMGFIFGRSGR